MSVHLEAVRGQCSPVHCIAAIFFLFYERRVQLNKRWHLSFHRKHSIALISLLVWVWVFFFSCFYLDIFELHPETLPSKLHAKAVWRSSFMHGLTKNRHLSEFKTSEAIHIALMVTHKDVSNKTHLGFKITKR